MREAWGAPGLTPYQLDAAPGALGCEAGWHVSIERHRRIEGPFPTEAEALVAALEAAP